FHGYRPSMSEVAVYHKGPFLERVPRPCGKCQSQSDDRWLRRRRAQLLRLPIELRGSQQATERDVSILDLRLLCATPYDTVSLPRRTLRPFRFNSEALSLTFPDGSGPQVAAVTARLGNMSRA